jgi:hypothetical protein
LVAKTVCAEGGDAAALTDYAQAALERFMSEDEGGLPGREHPMAGDRSMTAPVPWSEPVRLSEVGRGPQTRMLTADPEALRRVAGALDLVEDVPASPRRWNSFPGTTEPS